MDITKEQLDFLITCPKKIIEPPKASMPIKNQCRRSDFKLQSIAKADTFYVHFRQSVCLPEDFSTVLQWVHEGRNITIFRCNGPHGGNKSISTHFAPHIHRLNLYLAAQDIFTENDVETTTEYATFESAIRHFCLYCGIMGLEKYFPFLIQPSLFDIE